MSPGFRIAAIGELLWDLLPEGAQLGGAPGNFAASAVRVGNEFSARATADEIFLVSRVGDDARGRQARTQMAALGLEQGPVYSIHELAAWDAIPRSPELSALAETLDAVYFGTLAQRSEVTRKTFREFVEATGQDCVRVCWT